MQRRGYCGLIAYAKHSAGSGKRLNMLVTADPEHGNPFVLLEFGLTAIALASAFAWPRLGNPWFIRVERRSGAGPQAGMAVASVGIATFLLRLAILPFCPVPLPFLPDDFSLMLACDTFAHGRLTNPTPAMWIHFETIHVDMHPTYMSMYFPAQGLVMAAGKVLFGNPWYRHPGLQRADVCGALLDAAGLAAAGLGAAGRSAGDGPPGPVQLLDQYLYRRRPDYRNWRSPGAGRAATADEEGALRYGMLMAVGIILSLLPGLMKACCFASRSQFVLGRWALYGKNRPAPAVLIRRAALPLLLIVAAGAWMGYYDTECSGALRPCPTPLTAPPMRWPPITSGRSPRPEPAYRHAEMRRFYYDSEMKGYWKVNTWSRFVPGTLTKVVTYRAVFRRDRLCFLR